MNLYSDIRQLKGIGEKKALALNRLGVFTLRDLIAFYPRRYEDRSVFKSLAEVEDGETVCIQVIIADEPRLSRIRKGLDIVKFRAVDGFGAIDISFFNQSYVKNLFIRGEEYSFYGKVVKNGRHLSMVNPSFENVAAATGKTGGITPVYRLTSGLNQRAVTQAVKQALSAGLGQMPETLPEDVLRRHELLSVKLAYDYIHSPPSFEALGEARRRLIFEEFFVMSCALGRLKSVNRKSEGLRFTFHPTSDFLSSLPFEPTGAQMRAFYEAMNDMVSGHSMNRLLQGDVGSGKTLVAAMLCWEAKLNGYLSAFMAPTEILAAQHYKTLSGMLSPFGMRVGLLTGSMSVKEKNSVKEGLRAGEYDLIVGTHALFSQDVEYPGLGLVITDEQHRFGVKQRAGLIAKGVNPHVLVMSATPIPRSLALIIFGDLDVSVLDELPPGRQKIDTFAVDESYRERLNGFIRKLVLEGRQVFVVCPMVDENDELPYELKSAEEHAALLTETFLEFKVGCMHGKMKARDKDSVMAAFVSGEINILVSTTVVEVGVDVPNAALMIIENAERFGLSQLHQLRGRVGRGVHKSWCILVSDSDSSDVKSRLKIMCRTNDGFEIAEEDLRLRGPGDFLGTRQHGLPEMQIANLGADVNILKLARDEADSLLKADPELELPEHAELKKLSDRLLESSSSSIN